MKKSDLTLNPEDAELCETRNCKKYPALDKNGGLFESWDVVYEIVDYQWVGVISARRSAASLPKAFVGPIGYIFTFDAGMPWAMR